MAQEATATVTSRGGRRQHACGRMGGKLGFHPVSVSQQYKIVRDGQSSYLTRFKRTMAGLTRSGARIDDEGARCGEMLNFSWYRCSFGFRLRYALVSGGRLADYFSRNIVECHKSRHMVPCAKIRTRPKPECGSKESIQRRK